MYETKFLALPDVELAYRVIEVPNSKTDSCCLMLHGAGVAGMLTYGPMLEHLTQWRWLLIPDLNGMGESFYHGKLESPLTVEQLSDDIELLLNHLNWVEFDIVGYSLGGLVALHLNHALKSKTGASHRLALLEPAGLDRESVQTLAEVRQRYKLASKIIRETGDVELGIAHFMDGVSPNRRKHPVAEATTQSRLAHRPIGFSYALDAVTEFVEQMAKTPAVRTRLIESAEKVALFSGALSHSLLQEHYEVLANSQIGWQHHVMTGCDHSLPFQKPRQIARLIESSLFD